MRNIRLTLVPALLLSVTSWSVEPENTQPSAPLLGPPAEAQNVSELACEAHQGLYYAKLSMKKGGRAVAIVSYCRDGAVVRLKWEPRE